MAGTLSAPNAIKDIYKKLVFFDASSAVAPYTFQYTDATSLDDIIITNVKNNLIFDESIKFDSYVTGPTDNYTLSLDLTQLAADVYGHTTGQATAGDHKANIGSLGDNWGLTNASIPQCIIQEQTDRHSADLLHNQEMDQIERLITGKLLGWSHADYFAVGVQNPYIEGSGGALIPTTQYIDSGTDNIKGSSAVGLIDADQILDTEVHHNRTWLEVLQNLWDGADVPSGSPPLHPSGHGAGDDTVGTYDSNYFSVNNVYYIADADNTNTVRPGTGNTTTPDATSIKDALMKLDYESHKNESWLNEIHEALYGADDLLDDGGGNIVGDVPQDNPLQFAGGTKTIFKEFGTGKDHDSWARHGNTNSGSYLSKETGQTGSSVEGDIGRVNSFSQAIAELDYQIKNLWDRRDLDLGGLGMETGDPDQGAQSPNSARQSIYELRADIMSVEMMIRNGHTSGAVTPSYSATGLNSYATLDYLSGQIDQLDAQLQHLSDAVHNSDTAATVWSSDVGAEASVKEDVNSLHAELDATQVGAGLDADGGYTDPGGVYTTGNVNLKHSIAELEGRLGLIDAIVTGTAGSGTYSTDIGYGTIEQDIDLIYDQLATDTWSVKNKADRVVDGLGNIKIQDNLDANNKQINNLSYATAANDAVAKAQLDSAALGFSTGYAAKVATIQIVDSASLILDGGAGTPGDTAPEGGLMAIDTSHTLANYEASAAKTWSNKGTVTLNSIDYEHGGIAYDATNYAPKTITTNTVYIDGIALADGDYVLVAGESLSALDGATFRESTVPGELSWHWRNGIWVFRPTTENGGIWERPAADILWNVDPTVTIPEGQYHPIREGYQNGLSVLQTCHATTGGPAYPVIVASTTAEGVAAGEHLTSWCVFTGIIGLGSGNVTTIKNTNEVHLDFNDRHFEIVSSSPDYLSLLLQPASDAYGDAGTDMVPFFVDSSGIGFKIDNNYFEFDESGGVDRLTLKSTLPMTASTLNIDTGTLVANLSGYENKVGIGTVTPDCLLHISGTASNAVKIETTNDGTVGPQLFVAGNVDSDHSNAAASIIEIQSDTDIRAKGILYTNADDTDEWFTGVPYNGASPADGFQIGYSDAHAATNYAFTTSNAIVSIRTTGEIGINEHNPDNPFHINSSGVENALKIESTSELVGIRFTDSIDTATISYSGNQECFRLADSGLTVKNYDPQGVPFRVEGGTDVTLADGSGYIQIGNNTGGNLALDTNEIMARDNEATTNLLLQNCSDAEVRVGNETGSAKLCVGAEFRADTELRVKGDNSNPGYFNMKLNGLSATYESNWVLDDTALHIGHNKSTRDIHIKTDDDNTPKGIEIEHTSGNLVVDGSIKEAGTSLVSLYANLSAGTKIPTGAIIMWSGALSTVPTGWNLCDGTSGTPNLKDRFIVGSISDSGSTHDIGDSGGLGSYDIALTDAMCPQHSHTTSAHTHIASAHTHSLPNSEHLHSIAQHQHTVSLSHGHNIPYEEGQNVGGGVNLTGSMDGTMAGHYHSSGGMSINGIIQSNNNGTTSNESHSHGASQGAHSHDMTHTHQINEQHSGTYHDATGGDQNVWKQGYMSKDTDASSASTTANHSGATIVVGNDSHSHATGSHTHYANNLTINGYTATAGTGSSGTHAHGLTDHTHTIEGTNANVSSGVGGNASAGVVAYNETVTGVDGADTTTSGGGSATGNFGGTDSFNVKPSFYALAFIMKA